MRFEFYDPAEYEPDEPKVEPKRFGQRYVTDPRNNSIIYSVPADQIMTAEDARALADRLSTIQWGRRT